MCYLITGPLMHNDDDDDGPLMQARVDPRIAAGDPPRPSASDNPISPVSRRIAAVFVRQSTKHSVLQLYRVMINVTYSNVYCV